MPRQAAGQCAALLPRAAVAKNNANPSICARIERGFLLGKRIYICMPYMHVRRMLRGLDPHAADLTNFRGGKCGSYWVGCRAIIFFLFFLVNRIDQVILLVCALTIFHDGCCTTKVFIMLFGSVVHSLALYNMAMLCLLLLIVNHFTCRLKGLLRRYNFSE